MSKLWLLDVNFIFSLVLVLTLAYADWKIVLRTLANSSSSRSSNTGTGKGLKELEGEGLLVVVLFCADSLSFTIRNSESSLIDRVGS